MSQLADLGLRAGGATDAGRVRQSNEDASFMQAPIFAVADGMGGHRAGEVASGIAIESIARAMEDGTPSGEALAEVLQEANRAVRERASGGEDLRGMATTCTVMRIEADRAVIAHVGDSRAYLFRGGTLRQLTEDHSIVGSMVRERILTPEAAARHPRRHVVLRAIGQSDNLEVDVVAVDLEPGDRVLLCTDGLPSMVDSEHIRKVLAGAPGPEEAARRLVELANEAGGEDNVTVIVVDVGSPRRRNGLVGRLLERLTESRASARVSR
jgi:serine/threonine protein phosphatase PrpC